MATEIKDLQERRAAMKKERQSIVKDLRNKKKRLTRLKQKAKQLSDQDLFDIMRTRNVPADAAPRRETNEQRAQEAPPAAGAEGQE